MTRPRGTDGARVIRVIETRALRGNGTEEDKCRIVIQYWDFEGREVKQMTRPRGTDGARVIRVIETRALRGNGTEEDKCRIVIQYWDFEGNLLAENDSCKEKE